MRFIPILFAAVLVGCSNDKKNDHNGISTEWTENENGTVSTLYIKRDGVVIAEVSAVSNTFTVYAYGSDGGIDLTASYYDTADKDAAMPHEVTYVVYEEGGNGAKAITYDGRGEVKNVKEMGPYEDKAQQGGVE